METQLTKEQAIALAESEIWKTWSDESIARLQLFQQRLFVPFDVFQHALSNALQRPVFTHEFGLAYDELRKELLGEKQAPTLQEIIELIPEEKRLLLHF